MDYGPLVSRQCNAETAETPTAPRFLPFALGKLRQALERPEEMNERLENPGFPHRTQRSDEWPFPPQAFTSGLERRDTVHPLGFAKLVGVLVMAAFQFCSAVQTISAPKGRRLCQPIRATPSLCYTC